MLERKENDIMMIKGMAGEYCDDDEQFAKISHFVCLAEHEAEKYEKEHNTEIINSFYYYFTHFNFTLFNLFLR